MKVATLLNANKQVWEHLNKWKSGDKERVEVVFNATRQILWQQTDYYKWAIRRTGQ